MFLPHASLYFGEKFLLSFVICAWVISLFFKNRQQSFCQQQPFQQQGCQPQCGGQISEQIGGNLIEQIAEI